MKYQIGSLLVFFTVLALLHSCTRTSPPDSRIQNPPPQIISINPTNGLVQSIDTIIGTGFNSTASLDSVFFNGKPSTIISATTTQLIVRVPASASTGNVSVHVNGMTVTGPVFTVITPPNMPTITSFTLPIGKPGDKVIIVGTNFSNITTTDTVRFNGVTANVTNASSNQLTSTVPIGATTGKITVSVNGLTATSDSIFTVINPVVTTLGGDMTAGSLDGPLSSARFNYPEGIAIDSFGNLFIADQYNRSIRKITSSGNVSTIATFKDLTTLMGVAVDMAGNIYTADEYYHSVYKVSPSGAVSLVSGNGQPGYLNGTIPNGIFDTPTDLAIDAVGNIFIADNHNRRIRKITPAGIVTTFAGSDTSTTYDGVGVLSTFTLPRGITVDKSGNIFVAEYSKIRKITPAGVVTTISGNNAGFADGPVALAQFWLSKGITVDGKGNIFIADRTRIREITKEGIVITIAGTGEYGFVDGIGSVAQFSFADGIVVDASGNLYVTDNMNNRIRKISFK
jgi:sugar lactone lactonase YvrE